MFMRTLESSPGMHRPPGEPTVRAKCVESQSETSESSGFLDSSRAGTSVQERVVVSSVGLERRRGRFL